jgi:hypothetical protein
VAGPRHRLYIRPEGRQSIVNGDSFIELRVALGMYDVMIRPANATYRMSYPYRVLRTNDLFEAISRLLQGGASC